MEPSMLLAPVAGRVIALGEVPDQVFSSGMLGEGCAIWPEESLVRAPEAGMVAAAMSHAVAITGDDGAEVLVHVGLDTVEMGGDGFELLVAAGEHVTAGQPLVRFDRAKVAAAGYPDCVIVAVSNAAELGGAELHVAPGSAVQAGEPLLSVGDAAAHPQNPPTK